MAASVTVRVVVRNRAAISKLVDATMTVVAAAAEMPWRDDLREAAHQLADACAALETTTERRYRPPSQ